MRYLLQVARPELTDDGRSALLLFVFSLLAAYNTGANLIFLLTAALLAAFLVSMLAAKTAVRNLQANVTAPPVASLGEKVQVTVLLKNKGNWIARFLRVRALFKSTSGALSEQASATLVDLPILLPGEEKRTTISVVFPMRGEYHLQWLSIESTFPLGLLTYPQREEDHEVTVIVPPALTNKSFSGLSSHEQESDQEETKMYQRAEGMTFFGLRKYLPGDPLKSVHWKSTARTGKLMVQEYQRNLTARYYVYLDLDKAKLVGEGKDSNLEKSISLCATLCHQLSRENNLTQVLIYQDDVQLSPPIFTSSDAYLMLRFLGSVTYTQESSFDRLLMRTLPAIIPDSFLVFILISLDETIADVVIQAARPGQGSLAIFNLNSEEEKLSLKESPLLKKLTQNGIRTLLLSPKSSEHIVLEP